jgi:hypothetical protein
MEGQDAACLTDVGGLGFLTLPVVAGFIVYPVTVALTGQGIWSQSVLDTRAVELSAYALYVSRQL